MPQEAEGLGEESLLIGLEFDHYNAKGYPEDANGRLVLCAHPDGSILSLRGDRDPYLFYAQYRNRTDLDSGRFIFPSISLGDQGSMRCRSEASGYVVLELIDQDVLVVNDRMNDITDRDDS